MVLCVNHMKYYSYLLEYKRQKEMNIHDLTNIWGGDNFRSSLPWEEGEEEMIIFFRNFKISCSYFDYYNIYFLLTVLLKIYLTTKGTKK